MCSHIYSTSAPRPTLDHRTSPGLTCCDRNCFVHRFLAPNPTKELQAPQQTHILSAQQSNVVVLCSQITSLCARKTRIHMIRLNYLLYLWHKSSQSNKSKFKQTLNIQLFCFWTLSIILFLLNTKGCRE
jgi:hypothetical protein